MTRFRRRRRPPVDREAWVREALAQCQRLNDGLEEFGRPVSFQFELMGAGTPEPRVALVIQYEASRVVIVPETFG